MELSDSARITNLLSRFATLADVGTLDEIAETLADDVVWEMAGMTWTGKDAVVAGLSQMRAAGHAGPGTGTRHLVTNLQIEPDGLDAARAHSYFLFIAAGSPPSLTLFGEYRDLLRRQAGHWVIAYRLVITWLTTATAELMDVRPVLLREGYVTEPWKILHMNIKHCLCSPNTGVIITGGASCLGRASAHALAAVGWPVVIWDINGARAVAVADEIRTQYGVARIGIGIDISVPAG